MADSQWTRLAEHVRERREALRLSQDEVAVAAGVKERTYRLIENAERTSYRPSTLREISRALWSDATVIDSILRGGEPPRSVDDRSVDDRLADLEAQVANLHREVTRLSRLQEITQGLSPEQQAKYDEDVAAGRKLMELPADTGH